MEEKHPVVVMVVPFVAQGHLNQLLHLSRLLSSHRLPVHIVGTTTHSRQAKLRIHGWDAISTSNIHFHEYQTPHFDSPPPDPNASTQFPSHLIPSFQASSHLRQPFAELLAGISSTSRRVVVIHDYLMSTVVQDVVLYSNTEAYVFHSASVFTVGVGTLKAGLFLGKAEHFSSQNTQLSKIPDTVLDCIPEDFLETILPHQICKNFNSGNIHDACKVIEGKFIDLLPKEEISGSTKNWAMGPFNPVAITDDENPSKRDKSLQWLDKQDQGSVIYVSFGTTTSLTDAQIQELAVGLEKSEQKFIWVLREADKGDIFEGEMRRVDLPKGFEERLAGKALVVREWAPQLEILAHRATGGFMSHCGWNSTIESITMGVPIAAWPIHSDQPRNATLVTEVLKIGISVRDWVRRREIVTSSTIKEVVRKLMASDEGGEMRKRAAKLGDDVRRSVEEGGVTRMERDSFVTHITR